VGFFLQFACTVVTASSISLDFCSVLLGLAHRTRSQRIFMQLTSFSFFSSRLISRLTHEQTTFLKKGDMPVKTGVITH
ncbi:hypothetical protein, partial [Serratia fonticola]|uniref:hypothetical protein n=1 Tax=Serratia fonticola TaxID=47917 RepID=UPI001C94942A